MPTRFRLAPVLAAMTALLPFALATPAAAWEAPLRPWFRELRTVTVEVDGDTLPFLLDTGGGVTLVTPEVAAKHGVKPYGRLVGHRMDGEKVEMRWVDGLALRLAGHPLPVAPVAVFDLGALVPPELPKLAGILSLDAFRGRALTLDWPGARLAVESAPRAKPLPVRFATGDAGASLCVLTPLPGRRGPLWFLLDSGDLRGTLVGEHAFTDSLLALAPDGGLEMRGAGPPRRLQPIRAAIHYDGVLGTEYLMGGPVTLDLRRAP